MRTIILTFIILLLSTVVHVTDSCSSWQRRERPKTRVIEKEQPAIETTTEQLIEVTSSTIAPSSSECPVCKCNQDSSTTSTTTTTTISPPPPPVVSRDTNLFKINGIPCPKEEKYKYFCGGRGRCFMIMFSEIDFVIGCECDSPYMGLRCEDGYYGTGLKTYDQQDGFIIPKESKDVPIEEDSVFQGRLPEMGYVDGDYELPETEGVFFLNETTGEIIGGIPKKKSDVPPTKGFRYNDVWKTKEKENLIVQNDLDAEENDANVQNERDNDGRNRRHASIKKMRRGKTRRFHSTNE
ncbi:hypothetical protein PVAND_001107 [Polypedilum vanderplanki]|uniref:EGF-like domain-containing protein n=1 Tax=Polypedilum vanderplanki TaxID=319348 RepID=A0A9J6BM79_POLVA|nr:hypothetical protein PVAND_001107 [Polypedilum vanderplanki]